MRQQKKLEFTNRLKDYRKRTDISQKELGEILGVSGNYIYLMESGQKTPGASLLKLFETFEHSPTSPSEGLRGSRLSESAAAYERLKPETLKQNIADEASHLPGTDVESALAILDDIRAMSGVLAARLRSKPQASSRSSSDAQSAARRASSSARTDPSR